MARKLIPNVLRLYEVKSENYTFPSCMHSAMAALNEDEAFDFSFFAGITGDLFTQVWNTHKWSYNDAYSSVYRDGVENPIKAAFDACGYEYEFVIEEEIKKNKAMYIQKIMDSIDKGFPVITYGIVGPPICSIICGYDNNGEILIGRSQFIDEPQADNTIKLQVCEDYFQKENGLDNSEALIFFIKKKDTPLISESIQKSILNIPALASLPPVQGKRPSVFGKQAFDAWADMLLWDEDFIDESMLASPLDTHGSCAVMLGTNIHYMRGYLDKAIHLCPDMTRQITELQKAYDKVKKEFDTLIDFQGGYQFNKRKELLSKSFRIELAQRIREIGCLYMKTTSVIRQRD